jgi:hypothetical protein
VHKDKIPQGRPTDEGYELVFLRGRDLAEVRCYDRRQRAEGCWYSGLPDKSRTSDTICPCGIIVQNNIIENISSSAGKMSGDQNDARCDNCSNHSSLDEKEEIG